MRRFRYLATNDEASDCSCCGRQGLKRVVWLVELDEDGNADGEPLPYGTTCGAHLLLRRQPGERKPKVSEANKAIEAAERETMKAAIAIADAMTAPTDVVFGWNKYGVRTANLADVDTCVTKAYDQRDQCYEDRNAVPGLVSLWREARVKEILESWGAQYSAQRSYSVRREMKERNAA